MSASYRKVGRKTGERNHRAKLSDAQVARMRRMYRPGVIGYVVLSKEFGCAIATVRDIITYRTRP